MKKIKLGLIVTQESNPVNYHKAMEKLEKKKGSLALNNADFDNLVKNEGESK